MARRAAPRRIVVDRSGVGGEHADELTRGQGAQGAHEAQDALCAQEPPIIHRDRTRLPWLRGLGLLRRARGYQFHTTSNCSTNAPYSERLSRRTPGMRSGGAMPRSSRSSRRA